MRWRALPMLAFLAPSAPAAALELPADFGLPASVPVASVKEIRTRGVILQQHDFSCGSAALATLLTYHYGQPVSEAQAFNSMYAAGDRDRIRREGFSMLDLKLFLERLGLRADGVRASLDQLAAASVPAIVLIRENGYAHFVVVKGIRQHEILFGDPAIGLRTLRQKDFAELILAPILFVIRDRQELARRSFNAGPEWGAMPRGVLGEGVGRDSLANVTLLRRGPNDF